MESPVVLDKPSEYRSKGSQENDKGFPFDDEDSSEGIGDGWSELAARHPDIAARLRTRPSGWARKRRSSHNQPAHDPADDIVSGLGEHFNRFPFEDIPPEFREHLPARWGHRFVPQERAATAEQTQNTHQKKADITGNRPQQNTISTQTEQGLAGSTASPQERTLPPTLSTSIPQYGLRNTVDLGQKTLADSCLLDADEKKQRSMSAPPDNRVPNPTQQTMGSTMGGNPPPQQHEPQDHHTQSNVRHIPIFVEGRDEPIINKAHPEPSVGQSEYQTQHAPPPPEREQYFERDPGAGFHHPPHFSRPFNTAFGKGFRPGGQPFAPQAAYQQNASPPGRSQSPKPQGHAYTQIPVHHEVPKQQNYQHPQQHQHFQQPQQKRQQTPQPAQQRQQSPERTPEQGPPPQPSAPSQQPTANDPISKILNIQKDVLNLMNEVEIFVGIKTDKRYIYLDEMLTRNLIKLDDIDTEGKENIRQARREAIKCIQKCIVVLEAKADGKIPTPQPCSNMQPNLNGEAASSDPPQPAEAAQDSQTKESSEQTVEVAEKRDETSGDIAVEVDTEKTTPEDVKVATVDTKETPKKTKKIVKKRGKSKEKESECDTPQSEKNKDTQKSTKPAETAQAMEEEVAVPSQ